MLDCSFSILSMPISFSYCYRFKQVSYPFSADHLRQLVDLPLCSPHNHFMALLIYYFINCPLPDNEEHFSILFIENGLRSANENFKSNSNIKNSCHGAPSRYFTNSLVYF